MFLMALEKTRLQSKLGCLSVVFSMYSFMFALFITGKLTQEEMGSHIGDPPLLKDGAMKLAGREDGTGTAACLLLMDDNHFLIEWLAFHYHALRLRFLIVGVDPRSTTTPDAILRRWEGRIKIETWNQKEQYFNEKLKANEGKKMAWIQDLPNETLPNHRALQRKFNLECLATHKRNGRGWTFLIDTDEYIHINPRIRESSEDLFLPKWKRLPSIQEPDSVYTMLMQLTIPDISPGEFHPCVRIARRQFSGDNGESTSSKRLLVESQGFNSTNFHTIRWRKWGYHDRYHPALPGKTIIDLHRLRLSDVVQEGNKGDPHNPLSAICPASGIFAGEDKALLLANHYMGSREQWNSRSNDARGPECRRLLYDYQNGIVGKFESGEVSPWLEGFFNSTGTAEAKNLLQGVGEIKMKRQQQLEQGNRTSKRQKCSDYFHVGDQVMYMYEGKKYKCMIVSSNCKGGCDVKCENESWKYEYNLKAHDMILLSGSEEQVLTE